MQVELIMTDEANDASPRTVPFRGDELRRPRPELRVDSRPEFRVDRSTSSAGDERFQKRERKYLTVLAIALGFSQGCALCFYVGSGGYYSALMNDDEFFVHACAYFYLPPLVVTFLQLLVDHRFDQRFNIRTVIRCRILFCSLGVAVCLAALGIVTLGGFRPGLDADVFVIGVFLGCFAAALLGASCKLFGAVDPRFVPYLVLGQTAAGVYTNVVARLLGFHPGCPPSIAATFFGVAAGTVSLITVGYQIFNCFNLMEGTYQHHELLLSVGFTISIAVDTPRTTAPTTDSLSGSEASTGSTEARQVQGLPQSEPHLRSGCCSRRGPLGFPLLCWSMALAQTLAIAMNMSLTPLSNQVAHGEYNLSQELLLIKLLSDFCGRSIFLVLPIPSRSKTWRLPTGILAQGLLVWFIELLRLPLWLSVFLWATGSDLPRFLANQNVLLWPIWLPLISTGAMSSSWAFVISVTFAPEELKGSANLLMSCSVYLGFFLGICIALFVI